MGGKLFNLPRMPRAQYEQLEGEVRRFLDTKIPGMYRIPRYYGDKADFGDMDVILARMPSSNNWDELKAAILQHFSITEYKTVGHVFSTSLRGLQTDFFMIPEEDLETTYTFMSFNDLGNFIGRICRRFDLKYGERGLEYVYRRAHGNYVEHIEVSRDFRKICQFLGLDYAAFETGFASLPAVFDWVIASPYFSVAPYQDDQTSNLQKRIGDRTTVARFVDYLQEKGVDKRPKFRDRKDYLEDVARAFPEAHLLGRIEAAKEAEAQSIIIANKFNGKRVMRLLPHLEGERLGILIRHFKASFDNFEEWVLATNEDEINARILAFANANGFASSTG